MGVCITKQSDKIPAKVLGAIVATGLMSFAGVIVETSMNITFPTLMREFDVTTSIVQWMTTLYLLVVAAIVPLSATLKRRFKTKQLFLTANLLFIVGLVLDMTAPIFPMLLLGRGIQGLGTGIALPLMFNIILEQVPKSKIGMMMGVGTLITAIAPALGPTFGGLVVATMSWRFIFLFLLPLLILSFFLGIWSITQKHPTQKVQVDGPSIGSIMLAFAGLIFGISNLSTAGLISLLAGVPLLIGILALIGFVLRSLHLAQPIIDLHIMKSLNFDGHVLAFTMFQIIALGLSFLLPNYIQLVNHSSALQAGLIVLPGAFIGAVFAPISGRILDHFGAKMPLILGSCIALVSLIGFAVVGRSMSNLWIGFLYFGFMVGIGLGYGNIMTSGLKQLSYQAQSDGNAVFNTLQQFAGAVGTATAAALVAAGQASQQSTAAGTALGSWHALCLLLVLMIIESITIFLVLRHVSEAAVSPS